MNEGQLTVGGGVLSVVKCLVVGPMSLNSLSLFLLCMLRVVPSFISLRLDLPPMLQLDDTGGSDAAFYLPGPRPEGTFDESARVFPLEVAPRSHTLQRE